MFARMAGIPSTAKEGSNNVGRQIRRPAAPKNKSLKGRINS